ncbi:nucleoside phosphorylase [Podospora australis]|uniref:Nucleoside phosphorylase n=1 Tax=Podospora australis TaxID=1536484 RepID=A0AAN6WHE4_9PEZI|nr:nucleoside phosphorylase [Podospora australis]
MLPTRSAAWNGFQALKSRLIGRLAAFSGEQSHASGRPSQLENDADLLEFDLRDIFSASHIIADIPVVTYSNMEQTVQNFLHYLNTIVNRDFINSHSDSFRGRSSSLSERGSLPCDIKILSQQYRQLGALAELLDTRSSGYFNLVAGPGSKLLFELPEGYERGDILEATRKWRELIEELAVQSRHSLPDQPVGLLDHSIYYAEETGKNQPEPQGLQKRASVIVNSIFKEFKQQRCAEGHELKLRVSNEWYAGSNQKPLDILLSCCLDEEFWQDTQCTTTTTTTFHRNGISSRKRSEAVCSAIQQANARHEKLYFLVTENGLFDISSERPSTPAMLKNLTGPTLSDLLEQRAFRRITPRDYLNGTACDIVGSRDKAAIALCLARCLMDFFDEEVDLASYSWNSEKIWFLPDTQSRQKSGPFYVSLRPASGLTESNPDLLRLFGPGNPILLSFARLLLEIEGGEKLSMAIHPTNTANTQKWGQMCGFVDVAAEKAGDGNYLKAVEGCLYLHMSLPRVQDGMSTTEAKELVRQAIYEKIVHNLELLVHPPSSNSKRKWQETSTIHNHRAEKRPFVSPQRSRTLQRPRFVSPEIMIPDPHLPNGAELERPVVGQHTSDVPVRTTGRPASRDDFERAILCALPEEFDAMSLLIDEFWDEFGDTFNRADGDTNTYTTGRIGKLDAVLVLLPSMGTVSAASAAASLRSSYTQLKLVLVTGVCAGVPNPETGVEILLGDVIISKTVIQYDRGRQYADGFQIRDTVEDNLGRPAKNIRNLLAMFGTYHARERLEKRAAAFLGNLQSTAGLKKRGEKYRYPGTSHDNLFKPGYQHKHHSATTCECAHHHEASDRVCNESRRLSCDELGCGSEHLVSRERLKDRRKQEADGKIMEAQAPSIFLGRIGSGDKVLKSGVDRDRLASQHELFAFEMEATGVWDEVPCILVKAVCDYGDSHKNKLWQNFSAATAAATTKALLERYIQTDKPAKSYSVC